MINHDTYKQKDVSENSVKNIGSYWYALVLDFLTNTNNNSWKLLHIDMIWQILKNVDGRCFSIVCEEYLVTLKKQKTHSSLLIMMLTSRKIFLKIRVILICMGAWFSYQYTYQLLETAPYWYDMTDIEECWQSFNICWNIWQQADIIY